jgi:hypothetical protein
MNPVLDHKKSVRTSVMRAVMMESIGRTHGIVRCGGACRT